MTSEPDAPALAIGLADIFRRVEVAEPAERQRELLQRLPRRRIGDSDRETLDLPLSRQFGRQSLRRTLANSLMNWVMNEAMYWLRPSCRDRQTGTPYLRRRSKTSGG